VRKELRGINGLNDMCSNLIVRFADLTIERTTAGTLRPVMSHIVSNDAVA
jgi:hypothetical protein